uniref:PIN domain-containing protein n=2 Tax=Candidatus Kentrum sp. TC TaxID=2126339 RepID=A0A450YLL3_9GAMM|nr:MAG: hypothetical protein BECKTC1821D_GA0114238_101230 [Candidatus Kentron sp. TC]
MLANALVCPDLESIQKNLSNVSFYFDTPLLLNLLDVQGRYERDAMRELIQLVKKLKGKTCVFSHTIDEIRNVLQGVMKNIRKPTATGAVIREIRKHKVKRSDLILLLEELDGRISENGISVASRRFFRIKYIKIYHKKSIPYMPAEEKHAHDRNIIR